MKVEAGKTYVDGYDRKVRIICTDRKTPGPYTVVGLQIGPNNETATHYTEEGKGWRASGLVKEYKEPRYIWVNVDVCGRLDSGYTSQDYADKGSKLNIRDYGPEYGKRIGLIRINRETGQAENIKLEA